jgi:hypothetical protein
MSHLSQQSIDVHKTVQASVSQRVVSEVLKHVHVKVASVKGRLSRDVIKTLGSQDRRLDSQSIAGDLSRVTGNT